MAFPDWFPRFTDRIPLRRSTARAEYHVATVADLTIPEIPDLAWQGRDIRPLPRRTTARPEYRAAMVMGTAPLRSVGGMVTFSFPDEVPSKTRLHVSRVQWLAWPARSQVLPPAPVTARAFSVDRHTYRRMSPLSGGVAPLATAPIVTQFFRWQGVYPVWLERRRMPVAAQRVSVLGTQALNTVRLEWRASYPDRAPRAARVAWDLASALNLDPLPNAPAPDFAWHGQFPDQIWPHQRLRTAAQQAAAGDPRVHPPSPDLAWQGEAPDWIARRTMPAARQPVFSYVERVANIAPDVRMDWRAEQVPPVRRPVPRVQANARPLEVSISPTVWVPERQDPPDAPWRRAALIPGGATQFSALIVVSERVGWQVQTPVPGRPPAQTAMTGGTPTVFWPLTILPDEWCITLGEDAGFEPVFASESVWRPALTNQAVIIPTLADEEVC